MSTNLYKKVVIHDNNVFDCNSNSEPTIIEDFIKGRCKAFVSDEINGVIQEDPKGVVIKNEVVILILIQIINGVIHLKF